MDFIASHSIKVYDHGYCSQTRSPPPPISTIEDGVEYIENILRNKTLCWHDVENINAAYRKIDLLEKTVVSMPARNSNTIISQIIEKIQKIVSKTPVAADDLISLYHLQNFSDQELHISEIFNSINLSNKSLEETKTIATNLPCCNSKMGFDNDTTVLLGANPSPEVSIILNRKRERLQNFEQLKQQIEEQKKALNRRNHLSYLDDLLDSGYIHLYEHLSKTQKLKNEDQWNSIVEQIPFSLLSHIILETREAIIEKVQNSIPLHRNRILFLLGGTRAGKSTTLCFLRGDKMVLNDDYYESKTKNKLIGHEEAESCTFLPNIEVLSDWVIVDFPGFDDTNGPLISLGMELALKHLIQKYHPTILVLESITNDNNGLEALKNLGKRLSRILKNKEKCILGITKYSKNPDFIKIKHIEEQHEQKRLDKTKEEERALHNSIKDLSELNISIVDPESKAVIEAQIKKKKQQLEELEQQKKLKLDPSLRETTAEKSLWQQIKNKEMKLCKASGLQNIISFYDLEDANRLASYFATLNEKQAPHYLQFPASLHSEDVAMLERRFNQQLKEEINIAKDGYFAQFKDPKTFMESVLDSSLINTLTFQSHPEIGQFLHLPEMDPDIVRGYDEDIIASCITKYIDYVVHQFKDPVIERGIKDFESKGFENNVIALKVKLKSLQQNIITQVTGTLPGKKQ